MANAATIAGLAFSNAFVGVNHALAHALGARFGVAHGRANALFLPHVLRYNASLPSKFMPAPGLRRLRRAGEVRAGRVGARARRPRRGGARASGCSRASTSCSRRRTCRARSPRLGIDPAAYARRDPRPRPRRVPRPEPAHEPAHAADRRAGGAVRRGGVSEILDRRGCRRASRRAARARLPRRRARGPRRGDRLRRDRRRGDLPAGWTDEQDGRHLPAAPPRRRRAVRLRRRAAVVEAAPAAARRPAVAGAPMTATASSTSSDEPARRRSGRVPRRALVRPARDRRSRTGSSWRPIVDPDYGRAATASSSSRSTAARPAAPASASRWAPGPRAGGGLRPGA